MSALQCVGKTVPTLKTGAFGGGGSGMRADQTRECPSLRSSRETPTCVSS